jgi:alginate O-acetyltransferase complex protein AlgJ
MQRIERECEVHGGGDWNRWFAAWAPFRAALARKVIALKPYNRAAEGPVDARCALLEADGDPPLFETCPVMYLRYLYAPANLGRYIETRRALPAMKTVAAWLRTRGIDLIVVPVPKMTEVYADRIGLGAPPGMVVAPQSRRLLLELLKADVEVVDLLPAFLEARGSSPEPLYRPVDPHWGPRGMAMAAKEIGERLKRYEFVRTAQAEPPGYTVTAGTEYQPGAGYPALDPQQKRRVEEALTSRMVNVGEGSKKIFSSDAAVIFIGDSYNYGLLPLVVREINMPIRHIIGGGHTTEAIRDFVRDPTLLHNCRVVVWVNHFANVSDGKWDLPPLP